MTRRPINTEHMDASPGSAQRIIHVALIAALVVLTIFFDMSQPLGVAAGMKYVLLVLAGLLAREIACVWVLATLASFLTVVGYYLSPAGADNQIVLTNRFITLMLIWAVAFVVVAVHLHRQQLRAMSQMDCLTGAHNRNFLSERLKQLVEKWIPGQIPLCLIVIDIDHFKSINDRYGHLAGDHVLRCVAKICQDEIRQNDSFCRYGGDEFVVVLPELDLEPTRIIAERLRERIENSNITIGNSVLSVTVSLGLSKMTRETRDHSDLFQAADEAVYAAKSAGRNRAVAKVRGQNDSESLNPTHWQDINGQISESP